MTKDVLISISGLHFEDDENETVEVVTPGNYYFKNNKHYLLYDEYLDDSSNEITKNKNNLYELRQRVIDDGLEDYLDDDFYYNGQKAA